MLNMKTQELSLVLVKWKDLRFLTLRYTCIGDYFTDDLSAVLDDAIFYVRHMVS